MTAPVIPIKSQTSNHNGYVITVTYDGATWTWTAKKEVTTTIVFSGVDCRSPISAHTAARDYIDSLRGEPKP